jgi:hypothetical protein
MIAVLGGLADVDYPHPHRSRAQPGEDARKAHGSTAEVELIKRGVLKVTRVGNATLIHVSSIRAFPTRRPNAAEQSQHKARVKRRVGAGIKLPW